jgi:hypothetical protein
MNEPLNDVLASRGDCTFAAAAEAAYHDTRFAVRLCDHCEQPYQGPAVYCCLGCALADA